MAGQTITRKLVPGASRRSAAVAEGAGEPEAVAVLASVAAADGAAGMVELALREWGRLDIVVNNAGTVPNGQGIAELSDEEWDRMLGVNLRGSGRMARVFIEATRGARASTPEGFVQQWAEVFEPDAFAIPGHALDAEEANISDARVDWLRCRPA